jgi:hypothetical protein
MAIGAFLATMPCYSLSDQSNFRYAWGQQPEAFIASWNMVTAAVRAKAPETCMSELDCTFLGCAEK